ncbi:hypothetical protein CRENBAI_007399 [Crenichthys baileyi]|uniref:Uncharacterized protein n=1 Tax=Crenichthys baileyi TaxID=28760 RepID=A0AAV9S236_9TELE
MLQPGNDPRSGSVDKAVRELQQQQLMNSGKKSSSLRNIWSKKLEGSRSSNSGRTQQRKRHQMMDDVFQPRLGLDVSFFMPTVWMVVKV